MEVKKRLTAVICAACMLCGTAAEFFVYAENYGTTDNYIIGEKGMACIKTVDEDGNYLDINLSSFDLYNESGDKIGYWHGNNGKTFHCSDSRYNMSSITSGGVSIGKDDMPDMLGNQETLYSYEIGWNLLQDNQKYNFDFGKTFDATVKYFSSEDDSTVLVLTPHSFCVAADAGWAQKQFDWGLNVENCDAYSFRFRDLAGTRQIITLPDGDYPYSLGYRVGSRSGSGGAVGDRIITSDKSSEYALKKIRLSDIYPSMFDSKGMHTHDFFGNIYNYNFGVDDKINEVSGCLIFFSGDVVTAPIPDAEGYVSIYVDKSTNFFYMMTDYFAGSASGGGTSGSPGYPYRVKKFSFSTPSVPDQGIVLSGMDDGKYTVKASYLPDEYEADDAVFTVGSASDGVPVCTLTAKRKRYSIKVSESQHGVIGIYDDVIQAVKGQKISLYAVSDKGYRFKECSVTDEQGNELEIDKDQLNQDGIFYMPGQDTYIKATFQVNYGDINLDNRINASDMVLLREYILSDETNDLPVTADMNSNGKVDIFDYIRLKRMLVSNNTEQ